MTGKQLLGGVLAAAMSVASVGCQSLRKSDSPRLVEKLDIPNGVPWKGDKKPKPGTPARVVATWKDAVLQQPGQPAQRGFGGRLFFYNSKEAEPIPVEGQLVVYAFDETAREPTDNKPTRRYVFPPEQFKLHQSESEFGVSYSFWLPWDMAPGAATDVSLIARFEPIKGGAMIVSEQATPRLPGDLRLESVTGTRVAQNQIKTAVEQVSHAADIAAPAATVEGISQKPKRQMETTSIKLPNRPVAR